MLPEEHQTQLTDYLAWTVDRKDGDTVSQIDHYQITASREIGGGFTDGCTTVCVCVCV